MPSSGSASRVEAAGERRLAAARLADDPERLGPRRARSRRRRRRSARGAARAARPGRASDAPQVEPLARGRVDARAAAPHSCGLPAANGQAVTWPGPAGVERPSSTSRTRRGRLRQRGRNGQPGGSSARSGGWPGICGEPPRRPPVPRSTAAPRSRPRVYGWRGARKSVGAGAVLDDVARVHHGDLVAGLARSTPRSWETSTIAIPNSCLQLGEQREDLILDRDVERRRRLVGEQQLRPGGDRDRDHHPLAHAAAELVRVGVEPALAATGCRRGRAARSRAPRASRRAERRASAAASR